MKTGEQWVVGVKSTLFANRSNFWLQCFSYGHNLADYLCVASTLVRFDLRVRRKRVEYGCVPLKSEPPTEIRSVAPGEEITGCFHSGSDCETKGVSCVWLTTKNAAPRSGA